MRKLASLIIGLTLLSSTAFSAAQFDGTNDNVATNQALNIGSNTCTIVFWLNWDAFANDDDMVLELSSNAGLSANTFFVDPNGSGGNVEILLNSTGLRDETFTRPTAGVPHHWTVYIDNSTANGDIRLWIDNIELSGTIAVNTKTATGNFAATNLFIMSRALTTLNGAGKIEDLAIYQGLLSDSARSLIYNSRIKGMPLQVGKPVLYLPFDDCQDGVICSGTNDFKDRAGSNTLIGSGNGNGPTGIAGSLLSYP